MMYFLWTHKKKEFSAKKNKAVSEVIKIERLGLSHHYMEQTLRGLRQIINAKTPVF